MPRALEDAGSSTLGVTWCRCQDLVTWSLGHLQVLPWWDEWRLRPWWNSNAHRCCLDRGDTWWHMVTLESDASCNFQSHSSPEIQKISHPPVKKWQENHKISQNHWLTVQSNSGFAAWIVQSRCLPQIWHGNLTLTGSQLTRLTRLTQLTQLTLTQVHVLGRDWNRHRIWWHWRHWSEGLGLSLRIYLARQRISCSTIGPACTDTLQNRTVITCSSSVSLSSEKTICKMIGQACPIRNRFARLPPAFPVATLSLTWITNTQKPKKRRWRKWEKKPLKMPRLPTQQIWQAGRCLQKHHTLMSKVLQNEIRSFPKWLADELF